MFIQNTTSILVPILFQEGAPLTFYQSFTGSFQGEFNIQRTLTGSFQGEFNIQRTLTGSLQTQFDIWTTEYQIN